MEIGFLAHNRRDQARRDIPSLALANNRPGILFRIQKSDLRIRPIWHQTEERVQSHILVCFLAYVLWCTLAKLCKQTGLGNEPRRILDEISRIKSVDVVLPTKSGFGSVGMCISEKDT